MTLTPPSKEQHIQDMEENFFAYMSFFARQLPYMRVVDKPSALIVDSGVASDTFNYVCRARFNADVEQNIEAAVNYFKSKNLPYAWWVSPNSQPHNLGLYLERCGLKQTEQDLGMVADLTELPLLKTSNELVIKRVDSVQTLHDFAFVVSFAGDSPDLVVRSFYENVAATIFTKDCPLRLFVAYFNEKPVSTSGVFLDSKMAGIYSVATLKAFRRRGFGTAVTLAALHSARNEGHQFGSLQASEDGKSIYESLGFHGCCHFYVYQ
jgi:ribosomal protein S18 acetylase RimI-like enzyme